MLANLGALWGVHPMDEPTHPALRAVDESGGRLMMAEGRKWGAQAPRLWFDAPSRRTRTRSPERIEVNRNRTNANDEASLAAPEAGALPSLS